MKIRNKLFDNHFINHRIFTLNYSIIFRKYYEITYHLKIKLIKIHFAKVINSTAIMY